MTFAVGAIVLAAGESTRMGTQKALLEWEGVPLIAYELDQLAQVPAVRETIVVTGHEPERVREIAERHRATVVHNPAYASGKVTSILAGLHALPDGIDAVMVLAVDQPRRADVLRGIVDAHAAGGCVITAPVHGGRRGHPTLFSAVLLPELLLIDEGSEGLRAVMRAHRDEVHEVECDASVHVDLNRPADIARMRDP